MVSIAWTRVSSNRIEWNIHFLLFGSLSITKMTSSTVAFLISTEHAAEQKYIPVGKSITGTITPHHAKQMINLQLFSRFRPSNVTNDFIVIFGSCSPSQLPRQLL